MVFIDRLISYLKSQRYEALQKKNDDCGIEEAQDWIRQTPLQEEVRRYDYRKIDRYAYSIIEKLRKVPITNSNLEIIKNHLVKLAEQRNFVRQDLIKYISKI